MVGGMQAWCLAFQQALDIHAPGIKSQASGPNGHRLLYKQCFNVPAFSWSALSTFSLFPGPAPQLLPEVLG